MCLRSFVRTIKDPLTVSKPSQPMVLFPVVKTVPSDAFKIVSSVFDLKDSNNISAASGVGATLGDLIATFKFDSTLLPLGNYILNGIITLDSGEVLVHTQSIEII